jgi:hypothetical protein
LNQEHGGVVNEESVRVKKNWPRCHKHSILTVIKEHGERKRRKGRGGWERAEGKGLGGERSM